MAKSSPKKPADDQPISPEERDRLFEPLAGRPLALCVSGGPDSMALMHLVAEWVATKEVADYWKSWWESQKVQYSSKRRARIDDRGLPRPNWLAGVETRKDLLDGAGPPPIVVITVDHGLRPDSADEARFVAQEANKCGLPHQTLLWNGEKPVSGIQEAARSARYGLLLDLLQAEAAHIGRLASAHKFAAFRRYLVMAHHQEDQAETILMRLARGSGLEGLAGMRDFETLERNATREGTHGFRTYLLRPILEIPKARLVATLKDRSAEWVDDPSNDDARFERVRIRKVMDALKPLGFTSEKIALSGRRLRDVEDDLRDQIASDWDHPPPPINWYCGLYGEIELQHRFLDNSYLLVRTLRRLLQAYGGASKSAELSKVEALAKQLRWPEALASSGGLTLGGCKLEIVGPKKRTLRVYREGQGEQLPEVELHRDFDLDWDGGRYKVFSNWAVNGETVRPLGIKGWAQLKRSVPKLEILRWPAAAMATMPVVAKNGEHVAYPVIDKIMRQGLFFQAREDWKNWSSSLKKDYSCQFCEPRIG